MSQHQNKCPAGKIINPLTGKCIAANGILAKKLVAQKDCLHELAAAKKIVEVAEAKRHALIEDYENYKKVVGNLYDEYQKVKKNYEQAVNAIVVFQQQHELKDEMVQELTMDIEASYRKHKNALMGIRSLKEEVAKLKRENEKARAKHQHSLAGIKSLKKDMRELQIENKLLKKIVDGSSKVHTVHKFVSQHR